MSISCLARRQMVISSIAITQGAIKRFWAPTAEYSPHYLEAAAEALEAWVNAVLRLAQRKPTVSPPGDVSPGPKSEISLVLNGGRHRDRTCDPFHVKEVLSR